MGKIYKSILNWNHSFIAQINKGTASQKKTAFAIVIAIMPLITFAQVNITAPILTVTTCGTFPTNYFTLGDIVIKEQNNGDFSLVSNGTLTLTAPANFEFQPGIGSLSYSSGSNISSATAVISSTTITITYTVTNTNKTDSLKLNGLKIRGINGAVTNQTITRTSGSGSSAVINGDAIGTIHATLNSQILPSPAVTTSATQTSCSGSATAIALTSSPSGASFSCTTGNVNNVTGASSGSGTSIIQTLASSGSPGTVDYIVTPTLNGCTGSSTTITNTVNPVATVTPVASQVVCNQSATSAVSFSSPTNGGTITYNWVNNTTSIGLASSGTGNIPSFVASNNTNAPVTATITVTPSYFNAGVSCTGTPATFTITVNPTATVTGITDQIVCNNTTTSTIVPGSAAIGGTVSYTWKNNLTSIGLASSGNGNIPSFTAKNLALAPATATVTVTPAYSNGGATCTGTPFSFSYTVNPIPSVNAVANQTICNNSSSSAINFTSANSGSITYNWINNAPYFGLAASGTGNIPAFVATNNATTPVIATITVTPGYTTSAGSCSGTPTTFTITVNPTTTVNDINDQVVCAQSPATVNFTSPTSGGTLIYKWSNSNSSIGLAASGSGNIGPFTALNSTINAVTSTITVTPSILSGGKTCVGNSSFFTMIVNPLPVLNAVNDITECNNGSVSSISVTGNLPGTSYSWINDQTSIGLASAGAGNIPSFIARNSDTVSVTAPITLAGSYTNLGVTCSAVPKTFNIIVNPTIVANAISSQTICNNSATSPVTFSSRAGGPGTVSYNWNNDNSSIGLATTGTGDIPSFSGINNGNAPAIAHITVTPVYSYNGKSCAGTSSTFTITVNPSATVTAVKDQSVCNNADFALPAFTSTATGGTVTYNWTNSNNSIGLASTGSGSLPSFLTANSGNSPVSGTIEVTPVFSDGTLSCTGNSSSFVITVNPTANVNPVSNQIVCNNSVSTPVNFSTTTSGSGTISYNWTNNTASIGLAASGIGNIPSFTAVNNGVAPVTATITVTPVYSDGVSSCAGTAQTFTITVNPSATLNSLTDQAVCNNSPTGAINFGTSATGGSVSYAWTNNTPSIGLAASGNGNIPSFTTTNATNSILTGTITVIPTFTNTIACPAPASTFKISVNPTPAVDAVSSQTVCANTSTDPINFTGNVAAAVYQWTNNANAIGLASSGNGNIPSFTAVNSGTTAVNAIITVTPSFTNGGVTCNGSSQSFTIKVNPLPVPSLTGPNPICPNSTDVYTTESGMNNYTWTQTGGTITGGGTKNDPSATILWGNTAGVKTIYINYTDINGCTGATSVTVANGAGSSPGLTGPAKVCLNSSSNIYTTESGKLNYSWNIPAGGTIISGGGSNDATATVRWDAAGSKTISVNYSDVGGCNAATPTSFPVTVNALPTASVTGNSTVCLNSTTSKIIFTGTTGTAPYTFTYNINNGPNQTISTVPGNNFISIDQPSTAAGTFTYNLLSVQEASSIACSQPQTGAATVVVKPLPTATISGTIAVCANTASPSVTFTGAAGMAAYTFSYSVNGGGSQTVSTVSGNSAVSIPVTTSAAGTFQYKLINVSEGSANSCSQTQTGNATVTINPLPTAAISGSATVCTGSASPNITFTGSAGTAPYTFVYSVNGGSSQTITSTGNTATVAAPTNVAGSFAYTLLSVTDASSTACAQSLAATTATIKVDSKPVGGTLSPDVITGACSGSNSGSITLSGQLGNVTRWEFSTNGGASWSTVSPNVTSGTLTYSNLSATSLYRAVLQNGVCSDTAVSKTTIVVVSPVFTPVVKYLPTLTICVGDSVTMSASGLSNDKTSIVDGAFDDANPAGWSVTNNGSSINFPANADNANVHPWSETNGPKTYFSGTADAITYDSQFDKKFAIANGAVTTTLETPVFSLVGMVSPTFDFYQAYNLKAGTTAKIEISTDGGAHYTGILAQYLPGTLGVTNGGLVHTFVPLTNYIGLDNLKVKFTYSSTTTSSWALDNLVLVNTFLPVSYLWHSEGTTYTTQTITVSPPVGSHIFDLITQTGLCSITTTELTVIVNGRPTITPGTASVCNSSASQTLTLPYTNPTYSPSNYSITWNAPTNGLVSLSDTILSSSSIPVKIPAGVPAGSYSGTIKVSNPNGCLSPGTAFNITVNQTPVITNQAPAAFCSTGSVTLNSSAFTGTNIIPANTTYTWTAPVVSGITGLTGGISQASFSTGTLTNTTSQPVTIVYTVIPTSPSGCPGAPFTVTVTVNPTQIISAIPLNITLCPQPFSTITTSFSVQAANATLFQWQENNGSGWVNLANGTNYSGVTTNTLTINNITEAMEGYQYRSSLSNPSFCYSTYSAAATLYITNIWKGTTSTDWATASNWWGNVVPDINCQYVVIPVVSTKLYPILKGTEKEEVRNIVIRQNASVIVKESATLQVRGAIYANIANFQFGTLDGTDGKIELTGGGSHTYLGTDTAQIIAGSLFKIRTLKDLQISNPLGATVQSTANDTLNITGTLSFGNVNNTILHTGNNITLISNALGTARVADITNNSVNAGNNFDGDVIVERYINTGDGPTHHEMAWEFLAVPTQGQTIKQSWMENGSFAKTGFGTQIPSTYGTAAGFDLYSPFASIKYYKPGSSPTNLSSPDWLGVTNTSLPLYNPSGYMIYIAGDRSVAPPFYEGSSPTRMRSKGKLFTYKISIPVTASAFNSIGNPYASAIDMRKVLAESPAVSTFYTTWASPERGTFGFGAFTTYSKSGSDFVSTPGGVVHNNVESGQAFLVQATSATNGNMIFNETSKVSGSSYTVFRIPSIDPGQIRINMYTNKGKSEYLIDGTLSEFNEDFNPKVDANDAWKIFNGGENLSIVKGSKNLIIERTKIPTEKDTIFYSSTGLLKQNYRMELVCKGMSDYNVLAYLLDRYQQSRTALNMNDTTIINFNVTNDKASSASNRFEIVFDRKIDLPVEVSFKALAKEHNVELVWDVTNEKNMGHYEVERSFDGQLYVKQFSVVAANIDKSSYNLEDQNLLPGYYYYRLKSISITGKITYTAPVKVLIGDGSSSIKIYPNPVRNGIINLQLINQPQGKYGIRLINQLGQNIFSKQIERAGGSSTETIPWNYYSAHGVYQLEVTQPDGQVKLIKVVY